MNKDLGAKILVGYLTFSLIIGIIGSILSPTSFYSNWPYFIIDCFLIIILLLYIYDAPNRIILLLGAVMVLNFLGLQFLYYSILPDHYDYDIIQAHQEGPLFEQKIFQLAGKMQIFYAPDYPEIGQEISGYVSACSNDYAACNDLEDYTINATFIDEKGGVHTVLEETTLSNKTRFSVLYTGYPLNVDINIEGDKYSFVIPKVGWFGTMYLWLNKQPVYALSFILGLILNIVLLFQLCYYIYRKVSISSKKKEQVMCEECHNKWITKKRGGLPERCNKCGADKLIIIKEIKDT